jgi:hypothetical protein
MSPTSPTFFLRATVDGKNGDITGIDGFRPWSLEAHRSELKKYTKETEFMFGDFALIPVPTPQ